MKRIRVAIVDDSAFIRKALQRMLSNEEDLVVVGTAESGEELLSQMDRWRPDVITLDLTMPGMGGLPTLDHIMATQPTPVIILSTHAGESAPLTIEALHRGAVDFIDKQRYSLMDFGALRGVLLEKILQVTSASRRRRTKRQPSEDTAELQRQPLPRPPPPPVSSTGESPFDLLVVGASTGGPPTIERILTDLGPRIGVPLVVAQHMPPRFTQAFAERLNAHLPLQVREASHGEELLPTTAYIAPGGQHLRIERNKLGRLVTRLGSAAEGEYHQPSVDVLFHSAATAVGDRAVAVLLTGMGRDGAAGMMALSRAGAWTIAQDRDSCIVYGMPQAAVSLGAVREILPQDRIGKHLRLLLGVEAGN